MGHSKKKQNEEFIADVVEEKEDKKKKLDVMKGKNKIKVLTKSKTGTYDEGVVSRFRSILAEEEKVEDKKKEKEVDPRGMKTAISLYKNKLRAMGMKMEHHQKDKDGNTIPHEGEEINEVIGQLAGGLVGSAMGKGIAGKAIGGAIGAGAGEVHDPFKKGKDKNLVAAALGGAATGAVSGGAVGKLMGAENMAKGKEFLSKGVEKIKNKITSSHELEGDELVETPKIDQKLRKDAKPIKPGPLYKTGRTKEQMGDKAVASRRNIRNADDRNAADKSRFGSMSPAKETAERREKHMAARGVKTKGMSEGTSSRQN